MSVCEKTAWEEFREPYENIIGSAINDLADKAEPIARGVGAGLEWAAGRAQEYGQIQKSYEEAVGNVVETAVQQELEVLQPYIEEVGGYVEDGLDYIEERLSDARQEIEDGLDYMQERLSDARQEVGDGLDYMGERLSDAGQAIEEAAPQVEEWFYDLQREIEELAEARDAAFEATAEECNQ